MKKDNKNKDELEKFNTSELDFDEDSTSRVFGAAEKALEEKKLESEKKVEKIAETELVPKLIDGPQKGLAPVNVANEMKQSFLEYAMSVIVSRAIPDAKDGLKPVHRRILYGMHEIGLSHSSAHKKSARIVGDVLGKYHPHGDSSVYEAMVRLAQNFSMRYPLIDGHGNFGSIDGDSAAAMRYTEARLAKISQFMLEGIKKNAIPFVANYDGSETEPLVLPALFPNLLISGAKGIAVGMATEIPPHNLNETIAAAIAYAQNPDLEVKQLMEYIHGPDFPTGGSILGEEGIISAYETGNGSITMRAKSEIIKYENGKSRIIISEIPYGVLKTKIIDDIARAVKNKTSGVEGIADIRDESSSQGMRLIIEIKRNYPAHVILNTLYKISRLQTNFSVNMVALVNGVPETLNLKRAFEVYWMHQKETTRNVLQFDLDKAQARLHILEGLKIATDNIDQVISLIRKSSSDAEARIHLETQFSLSEDQSKAITEMRLGRLTSLAIDKMELEIKETIAFCKYNSSLLNDPQLLLEFIFSKLREIVNKYGDQRRTLIEKNASANINIEDLIEEQNVVITRSRKGYVKRIRVDQYRAQKRGGKGARSTNTYADDDVSDILVTTTHIDLLIFTSFGKVYRLKAFEIPESSKTSKGTPFNNFIDIDKDEFVVSWLATNIYTEDLFLLTVTKKGIVKRCLLSSFKRINRNGKIALKLDDDDELLRAMIVRADEEIIIGANSGYVVRFNVKQIRTSGRTARGVVGITLENSEVIAASSSSEGNLIFSLGSKGYGKKTMIDAYRKTNRRVKGVKSIDTDKAGALVYVGFVKGDEEIIIINSSGISIRTSLSEVSQTSTRNTKGVRVIRLDDQETIKSVGILKLKEAEEKISKTNELALRHLQTESEKTSE